MQKKIEESNVVSHMYATDDNGEPAYWRLRTPSLGNTR